MVKTISKSKITQTLLLALFAVFPFGQVIKIGFVNGLDIVAGAIFLFTIFTSKKYPVWYKYLIYFLFAGLFSWTVNLFILKNPLIFKGFLYIIRLFIYSFIPVFIFNLKNQKREILDYMLAIAIVVAVCGWFQYLIFPDLRSLKVLDWDDHFYRLVGTFLDPSYTAIILVLGSILTIFKKNYPAFVFLVFTLLFTYSRAGYLALFIGLFYFFLKIKRLQILLIFITCYLILITFLPTQQGGEGVNLSRTSSISARILNYNQSVEMFKKSPIIGVGLNNICSAKAIYLDETNYDSHSCFGLDNSILFILSTTGIAGLILFINFGLRVINFYSSYRLLITSLLVVLTASMFSNTLFYPHVMVWLGIILGLGSKIDRK